MKLLELSKKLTDLYAVCRHRRLVEPCHSGGNLYSGRWTVFSYVASSDSEEEVFYRRPGADFFGHVMRRLTGRIDFEEDLCARFALARGCWHSQLFTHFRNGTSSYCWFHRTLRGSRPRILGLNSTPGRDRMPPLDSVCASPKLHARLRHCKRIAMSLPTRTLPHLRQASTAGINLNASSSGQSAALQARVNEKKAELDHLRQLRDLSAAMAMQMEALQQKLATLADGTEGTIAHQP